MPSLKDAIEEIPLVPLAEGKIPERLGYIVNFSFHIWYKIVMEVMRIRARQYGISVEIKDAEQSMQKELTVADELLDSDVDVLVLTPAQSEPCAPIIKTAKRKNIPVVVEANPVPGMETMIAICDYDAGFKTGRWVGEYCEKNFEGKARILDISLPTLRPVRMRSEGFSNGVCSVLPRAELVARVNGLAVPEVSREEAVKVFRKTTDINVIFAIDDESAIGGLQAYRDFGLDESRPLVAGFGLSGDHEKELLLEGGPLKVSAAMFPEYVGFKCVDSAVQLYNRQKLPLHDVTPTLAMTTEQLPMYFRKIGQSWIPDMKAIMKIPREQECTKE